jgi:hypothetical protein
MEFTPSSDQTPPLPGGAPRKTSSTTLILVIVGAFVLGSAVLVAILAAILIPVASRAREQALRTADSANLRLIVQATLVCENSEGRMPPVKIRADGSVGGTEDATIQSVAAMLARSGGLNDTGIWMARSDERSGAPAEDAASWDYVTGLSVVMSANTPLAWTRGLRTDGTWDPATGVYGGDGGHIAFLGGHVVFFQDLAMAGLTTPDGRPTTNILEALPPGTRVVGAGPGTLHGKRGSPSAQ